MRTAFIIVREYPGSHCHATLRGPEKPWPVLATNTSTSGAAFAAIGAAEKAGYSGYRVEKIPVQDWNEATKGYFSARRHSAVRHVFKVYP